MKKIFSDCLGLHNEMICKREGVSGQEYITGAFLVRHHVVAQEDGKDSLVRSGNSRNGSEARSEKRNRMSEDQERRCFFPQFEARPNPCEWIDGIDALDGERRRRRPTCFVLGFSRKADRGVLTREGDKLYLVTLQKMTGQQSGVVRDATSPGVGRTDDNNLHGSSGGVVTARWGVEQSCRLVTVIDPQVSTGGQGIYSRIEYRSSDSFVLLIISPSRPMEMNWMPTMIIMIPPRKRGRLVNEVRPRYQRTVR